MDASTRLPARLFLLAYDPQKQRLTSRSQLGLILRAAALAELAFDGHLAEHDGRVTVVGSPHRDAPHLHDPVLAAVLADVAAGRRPRKWQHWVSRHRSAAVGLVRDQLAEAHVIRAERRRVLGLFPVWTISLRDTRARSRFAENARRVLRGGEPPDRLDRRDAAVVALAAAGELKLVVSRADRRQLKRRLEALGERVGPVAPALRKAVRAQQAAAASAG